MRRLTIVPAALVVALIGLLMGPWSQPSERAEDSTGNSTGAPSANDTLIIGMTQFPSTFHPGIDSMMAKSYILAMTRRPFTVYDADWSLTCLLCVDLPTFENGRARREKTPDGKDGVAVTYTIAAGATWGDGVSVTSADVVFTHKVGSAPTAGIADSEVYRRIWKVQVIDERTFTLHFDRLSFDYNAINGLTLLPAHLESGIFEPAVTYRNRTLYDTDTTNPGLYYGPYRISDVSPGSHVTLLPNHTWWGKKPYFKKIVVYVIENTAALEANLLSGSIHMIAGELGLTLDQALSFDQRYGNDFNIIFKPSLVYEHLDVNLDNPVLADGRVRRALLYGSDRAAISSELFGGKQPVANGPVSPLDRVYDANVTDYPYDPDWAAVLLNDAGWLMEEDGLRRDHNGETLSFSLMSTAGDHTREMIEQVLQSQWRQLGLEVRIRNQSARVFFGDTVTLRKFDGLAMFAWISSPENIPHSTLYSTQIPTEENNYSGQNYSGYKNPEMDALIDAIEIELDFEKRKILWKKVQALYAKDLPALPLYYRSQPFILPKWLSGLVPTGHQYPSTLWVENWGIKGQETDRGVAQ